MGSKTRQTTFRRIAVAGELAPLLVQLMMVVNDIGIAEHGRGYWSGELPAGVRDRARAAGSYFMRLQTAHTFEGLKVITKIKQTPAFMEKMERCDAHAREAFARLGAFIGTEEYKKMKRLRNAVASHCLADAVHAAICRQAEKVG